MDANAYRAIREHAALLDVTGRGKIRAAGDDRARLLHAMCTNHIQDLQPGTGCYAFFLTAQGRIVADANVFCLPDYLLLDTEPETRHRLIEHLEKYIIADDVTLRDFTDDTATLSLEGPAAGGVLESLGASPAQVAGSIVEWGHGQVAHCTYTGGPGYLLFVPATAKDDVVAQLRGAGVPAADVETADLVRMENGRPRYGVDFTEANIPQETQQTRALHFSKGCYLGQEIVERVRSRGHVNRLLTPLVIESAAPPAPGTKIEAQGREVGEVTRAAYSEARGACVGFGIVRAEALAGELTAGGAVVKPVR